MSTAELSLSLTDELLHRPDGEQFEVVGGELVERDMGALAGWVGNRLASRLDRHAETRGGWAFGDGVGYRCYEDDPERLRRPDASFIQADRLTRIPEGFLTIAPDLAVEVVSPSDLYCEVEAKVAEYLEAGVRMVWLVNPQTRRVRVFRPNHSTIEVSAAERLSGFDVVPGFDCLVSELFPAPVASH